MSKLIPINLEELELRLNGHSAFAPSSSKMWMTCSGSLIPNLMAHDTAGIDAATGTVAHDVGEEWLNTGYKPKHRIGEIMSIREGEQVFDIEIDEVMLDFVEEYVTWCLELAGDRYVEVRVDFSDLTPIPNQKGTSDCITCLPGHLVVTDLKYGKGIQVFAQGNTQGLLYAYGAFQEYDEWYHFEKITIRICQPRLGHFDTWTITRAELLEFAEYARERAHAAWQPNAPRKPSEDGCQWCKIKNDCMARAVFEERMLDGVFSDLEAEITEEDMDDLGERLESGKFNPVPVPAKRMSTKMLAHLVQYRKSSEAWWKSVDDELERRGIEGEAIPGKKLVESRTNRKFISQAKATKSLTKAGLTLDQVQPRSMITPAQAEELLRKSGVPRAVIPLIVTPLAFRPQGRPTLAPLTDKRQPIEAALDSVFDDLDADEL